MCCDDREVIGNNMGGRDDEEEHDDKNMGGKDEEERWRVKEKSDEEFTCGPRAPSCPPPSSWTPCRPSTCKESACIDSAVTFLA